MADFLETNMRCTTSRAAVTCLLISALFSVFPVFSVFPAPALAGQVLLVGGGSHDQDCDLDDGHWADAVYGWLIDQVTSSGPNGGNGRVLVLDIEADDGCDAFMPGSNIGICAYFECLGATEADHLCARSGVTGCVEPEVAAASVADYDAVWFRGGDQSIYVDEWAGTAVETALFDLWQAGGTLAGTSAGAMIQSELSSTGTAPSWQATANPYHPDVELTRSFLAGAQAVLPGILVDTHFTIRARLGRLATFLGLSAQDQGEDVLGLGIDQETAFAVTADGVGEVLGEGAVTILHRTETTRQSLLPNQPPSVGPLLFRSLTEGFRFDVGSRLIVATPPALKDVEPFSPLIQFTSVTIEGADEASQATGAWTAQDLTDATAFYDGRLTSLAGSGALPATAVMTALEAVSAERENRAGAPLWLLEENAAAGLVIFTDAFDGASCNAVEARDDNSLRALADRGCPAQQSALILDCSELEHAVRSTWDGDGNALTRHSVGLPLCHLTLLTGDSPPYTPRRLAELLFADGFESGTASRWSGASP